MSVAPDFLSALAGVAASRFAADLPGLRVCEAISGDFDEAELKRSGRAAPAVLVATLGARQLREPAFMQVSLELQMAAFVVTRTTPALAGPEAGLNIVQRLLQIVPEQTWGLADAGPAQDARFRAMVTRETRAQGVHLASVTWNQPVVLHKPDAAAGVPLEIYYSMAPEIGPDNIDDYTLAGEEEAP